MTTKHPPRSVVVSVRLTDAEHDLLLVESKVQGITVSELVRRACAKEARILRLQRAVRREQERMPQGQTVGSSYRVEVQS